MDSVSERHLEIIDLSHLSLVEAERETRRLAGEFLDYKIDLSVGPVFDAKLWKLSHHEHVLASAIDHMVSDGISISILNKEIWTIYSQTTLGLPYSLPHLPVQFGDYAVWQQQTCRAWMDEHETYWRERLIGAPPVQIPSDVGLVETENLPAKTLHVAFGSTLSAKIRDVAKREQTLPSLVILTAYAVVMARWCRQRDLTILLLSHGRDHRPELRNMIGYLVSLLYIRLELTEAPDLLHLLRRVHVEFHSAVEHRDFNRVPDLIPQCRTELMFNWRSATWARRSRELQRIANAKVRVQPYTTIVELPNWPGKFWHVFFDTPSGIFLTLRYRPDLLAPGTMHGFGRDVRSVAQAIADQSVG